MQFIVTKKEYEAGKNLGFMMVKELSKAETITGFSSEDVDTYETKFDESISSTSGKWGKVKVAKPNSMRNNKIVVEINEDCICDIMNELYNPMVLSIIKCIITVSKTFTSLFKKLESKYDKIANKWFSDESTKSKIE